MSATMVQYPENNEISLVFRIMPSFERRGNMFTITQSQDFRTTGSRVSPLQQLLNELKNELERDQIYLLDVILVNNNYLCDLTDDTTSNFLLSDLSSPIVYLFRKPHEPNSSSNNLQESNSSPRHDRTNQSNYHTTLNFSASQSKIYPQSQEHGDSGRSLATKSYELATQSFARFPEHFNHSLFVHVYTIKQEQKSGDKSNEISHITCLPEIDAHITMQEIHKIISDFSKKMSINDLAIVVDGCEINDEQLLDRKKCPFVTVLRRSSTIGLSSSFNSNLKAHEMAIRLCIYSIVFDHKYASNIKRFLNFCDRNKTFILEKRELEIALITLVELLKAHMREKLSCFTYFDLLIPESTDDSWSYDDCKRLFADTLIEYIRTRHLLVLINNTDQLEIRPESEFGKFMIEFLQCLDKVLESSLKIDSQSTQNEALIFICKRTLKYLLSIPVSPICFLFILIKYFIQQNEEPGQIIWIKLITYLCSTLLIVPIFNIILYYVRSVSSFEANQLEIYWPLALIVSTMTILHAYQTSLLHQDTYTKKKTVKTTYNKAHLYLLEAKSKPNVGRPNRNTRMYELHEEEQLHPTLIQESITESSTKITPTVEYFRYLAFLCLFIAVLGSVHACIPTIHRSVNRSQVSNVVPWYIQCIRFSYIGFSAIFYSIFVLMMIASIMKYGHLLNVLKRLLSITELMQQVDLETKYFLNLRRPENLEYFLDLFQTSTRRIDPNHLFISTMTCALLIDIIFILTAVIRVFVYGRSTDLLTIWCLIDIVILSFFIMLFVTIVVLINKLLTYDFIRRLKSLKKEMVTSPFVRGDRVDPGDYLDTVIQHIEGVTDEYAVKLLGFVVDHSLAIKILISIITGIVSAITALVQQ